VTRGSQIRDSRTTTDAKKTKQNTQKAQKDAKSAKEFRYFSWDWHRLCEA